MKTTNLIAAVVLACWLPSVMNAQIDSRVTLDVQKADIASVLKELFKGKGSFVLKPEVAGTITASIEDLPFETALKGILDSVGATYQIEGGLYIIQARPTPATLEFENVPVRSVLSSIFRKEMKSYALDPNINGSVTLRLTNEIPFEEALKAVLEQVDATYHVDGGIYKIDHSRRAVFRTEPAAAGTVRFESIAPASSRGWIKPVEPAPKKIKKPAKIPIRKR